MHHDLKSIEPHYSNVIEGIKPFEIRKNDRNYQTGDTVNYHQFENGKATGKTIAIMKKRSMLPWSLTDDFYQD